MWGTRRCSHTRYVHNVRIKPDLVAPGVRTTSTVPYQLASFTCTNALCTQYYPATMPLTYHSYAQGTSFAAPVVAGTAALLRKYLLDRGVNPAPSLVKAALSPPPTTSAAFPSTTAITGPATSMAGGAST